MNQRERNPELEPFASRLRELNAERGWSFVQVSSLTGISVPSVSNFANARQKPRASSLGKLARAYGCPFEELDRLIPKH